MDGLDVKECLKKVFVIVSNVELDSLLRGKW